MNIQKNQKPLRNGGRYNHFRFLDNYPEENIDKIPNGGRKTRCRVLKVVSGDTFDILFLLNDREPMKIKLRVFGIHTPDTRGRTDLEKTAALKCREKAEELLEGIRIIHSFMTGTGMGWGE